MIAGVEVSSILLEEESEHAGPCTHTHLHTHTHTHKYPHICRRGGLLHPAQGGI